MKEVLGARSSMDRTQDCGSCNVGSIPAGRAGLENFYKNFYKNQKKPKIKKGGKNVVARRNFGKSFFVF